MHISNRLLPLQKVRRKRRVLWGIPILTVLCAGLIVVPARAQPKTGALPQLPARPQPAPWDAANIEGTVLAIQGDELVLDLGASSGATEGSSVELWRPVKLKHPVTGKLLTDRFRIGALSLIQVRTTMTLARASGPLSRPAEVGDIVILARSVEIPAPGAAQPQRPAKPVEEEEGEEESSAGDPEVKAVTAMFDSLRGASPWTRMQAYLAYVRAHPDGRFTRVLMEEADALRELLAGRVRNAVEVARVEVRSFKAPTDALAGEAFRIAVELNDAATGAVLHFRKRGAPTYVSLPMTAIGNGYYAATIPRTHVVTPAIEYFIEGTARRGADAVVASPGDPHRLDVFEAPRPPEPAALPAKVEISTDYADYNRFRGNDRIWQTEGYFSIRRGDTGMRAVRSGFGVYRGVGGTVDDLDVRGLKPRDVGLTYGYLETEIGVVRAFSFIGRMAVGLLDDGVSGGGQLMIRIGSDLGTNLVAGGELLGGVGLRGITQFELNTFERFPIMLRTEITNQPAGFGGSVASPGVSNGAGDLGGRGIVQVGFRIIPSLTIAVRGSFQGRTINHAGPGFGAAVGYSW